MGNICCEPSMWLRSPNPNNANNEFNVNPDGSRNNNNANNSNGVVPDCEISPFQVTPNGAKAEQNHKERLPIPERENTCADAERTDARYRFEIRKIPKDGIPILLSDLILATKECKRNVLWKDSVAGFVKNRFSNCMILLKELQDGTYKLSRYTQFKVYEPKERDIVATNIRDRVVQRAICDVCFYEDMTKGFIYDNWACQIGKGTTGARKRLKQLMVKAWRTNAKNVYVLKADIKSYFPSTPHWVAKEVVRKRSRNSWVTNYVCNVVDSFDDVGLVGKGIGLGSQLSQLIELAVLDRLDHIIKEKLRVKSYIRYMDDIIALGSKKEMEAVMEAIRKELSAIGLTLSPKKTWIAPWDTGIKFLGFRYKYTETGKIIMTPIKGKENEEKRKLKRQMKVLPLEQTDTCLVSWVANAKQGTSYEPIKRMKKFYAIERRKCYAENQTENRRRNTA